MPHCLKNACIFGNVEDPLEPAVLIGTEANMKLHTRIQLRRIAILVSPEILLIDERSGHYSPLRLSASTPDRYTISEKVALHLVPDGDWDENPTCRASAFPSVKYLTMCQYRPSWE